MYNLAVYIVVRTLRQRPSTNIFNHFSCSPRVFFSPTSLSLPLPLSMLRKLCRRVGLSFSFHAKKFFKVTTNQRRSQEAIGQKSRQQNYFKLRNHNPYGNKNWRVAKRRKFRGKFKKFAFFCDLEASSWMSSNWCFCDYLRWVAELS